MGPKSAQSWPKVVPKSVQSRSKVGPKRAQSRPEVDPKSAQNRPQVGPKSPQSRPKLQIKGSAFQHKAQRQKVRMARMAPPRKVIESMVEIYVALHWTSQRPKITEKHQKPTFLGQIRVKPPAATPVSWDPLVWDS